MDLLFLIDITSAAVGTAIILGAVCILVHMVWLGLRERTYRATAFTLAAALLAWCSFMFYFSTIGNIRPPSQEVISPSDFWGAITAPIATLLPIVGFFWARRRLPALKALTDAMNMRLLIGVQAYRMTGSIFLLFALNSQMPNLIGIPTGIAAFLVGLLGVSLALHYRPHLQGWRTAAHLWNWLGLGYFSYAITLCLLCVAQIIDLDPDPMPIFFYPIAFIGSFGVPFSVILHFIVHTNLSAQSTSSD